MGKEIGIAAAGHLETARAAKILLEAGGNAFDAALGAMCAACVAEPMLASLGGGGFLMGRQSGEAPRLFDFFVQAPRTKRPEAELDFYPIYADFGTARQEFHIGMGSIAVPGVVAGLFSVHEQLCRLPIAEVLAPAIELARTGVRISEFQNYISNILEPILGAAPSAMRLVATGSKPGRIAAPGETVTNPELADLLEALAREGADWFYHGEPAERLSRDCREHGGMLTMQDLMAYRVIERPPVRFESHGAKFAFNSPPSPGGSLVAFALGLLEPFDLSRHRWGHAWHAQSLARAMRAASRLRREAGIDLGLSAAQVETILEPGFLDRCRMEMESGQLFSRGTTHISVADADGNLASLTVSNGEGCAYVLPGTGIMMNNMLGEEDLNPGGFHRWLAGQRMSSMMCPSLALLPDGAEVALGSGGSNRIRSAILQVLINLFEFDMDLEAAVEAPRIHLEGQHLSFERGFSEEAIRALQRDWPDHRPWPEPNMFFGGVHAVARSAQGRFQGAGDPRRSGSVARANQ